MKAKLVKVGVCYYLRVDADFVRGFNILKNYYKLTIENKGKKLVYTKIGEFKDEK